MKASEIEAETQSYINEIVSKHGFSGEEDLGGKKHLLYCRAASDGLPLLGLLIVQHNENYRVIIGSKPPERPYDFDKEPVPLLSIGNEINTHIKSLVERLFPV